MPTTIKEPKKYLFEKAHEAAVILRLTLPVLDESERETLEIMLDEPFHKELLKRIRETKKLHKSQKLLTLDELRQELGL